MALHPHLTKAASASKTDPHNNPAVYLQHQHVRLVRHRGAPPRASRVPFAVPFAFAGSSQQRAPRGAERGRQQARRAGLGEGRTTHWTTRQAMYC